jgi:hypothetical protein
MSFYNLFRIKYKTLLTAAFEEFFIWNNFDKFLACLSSITFEIMKVLQYIMHRLFKIFMGSIQFLGKNKCEHIFKKM